MKSDFRERIFRAGTKREFNELTLEIFKYQADNNPVYKEYISALGIAPGSVKSQNEIPYMPVGFFKDHKVITGETSYKEVFESSGTSGMSVSRHYITDPKIYEESFIKGFRYFYGDPADYVFAALLPSYIERGNSSLIYMISKLISKSNNNLSGFYCHNISSMISALMQVKNENKKGILLGVSFALLDLAEMHSPDLSGLIVMETGGMKGKRKEITREELHSILKSKLNVATVHSEYGMTELMSQAYSKGEGKFYSPPWMKVLIRDSQDPLTVFTGTVGTGGINIIDLANINSCSFIATDDLGKLHEDGGFEVIGRFDNSEIRGCNLLGE